MDRQILIVRRSESGGDARRSAPDQAATAIISPRGVGTPPRHDQSGARGIADGYRRLDRVSGACQVETEVQPTSARTRASVSRVCGPPARPRPTASSPLSPRADPSLVVSGEDEVRSSSAEVLDLVALVGIRGSTTSASPTRPSPSLSNVSTALIRAP